MNVPTIQATDCPRVEALASEWVIIITSRFPSPVCPIAIGYLGRLNDSKDGPNGLLRLDDPFDYQAVTEIEGAGKNARARRARQISPVDGLPGETISSARGKRGGALISEPGAPTGT